MKEKDEPSGGATGLRRRAAERLREGWIRAGVPPAEQNKERLIEELQIHQIELEMQNDELRRAWEEAETAKARYTDFYDFAPAGYLALDAGGAILEVNLPGAALLGVERAGLVNRSFFQFVWDGDRAAFRGFLERAFLRCGKETCEAALMSPGGSTVYAQFDARVAEGEQECRIVVVDVTARKLAEQKAREDEERFRRLVEGAPFGIFVQSREQLRYLNAAAVQSFGAQSPEQLAGRPATDLIHPQFWPAVTSRIHETHVEKRATPPREEKYLRLDGSEFDAEVSSVPVELDGEPGAIVFFRDITDRKCAEAERRRLEEHLQRAQKMESIGRLAGGLAHDFNNLLTVILGYSEIMIGLLRDGDPLRTRLGEIRNAGLQAAAMTKQLLTFSRKHIFDAQPLDLNELVNKHLEMLRRTLGEDVELVTGLDPSLGPVRADAGQLQQVLINLVMNARDAMPHGGKVCIETSLVELDRESVAENSEARPGPYVMLAVSDDGVGMDEQTRRRVFEPFFTTKAEGKGTGLGLATVWAIATQSGGVVRVQTEPGHGARFEVCLPRVEEAAAAGPAEPAAVAVHGSETVLVVEDRKEVRELVTEVLTGCGYHVLPAAHGGAALALARGHPGPIHLLLTDVVMPVMSGTELAGRLKPLHPETRVMFMSGYAADSAARRAELSTGAAFLGKPFSPDQLTRKVREVLGAAGPGG